MHFFQWSCVIGLQFFKYKGKMLLIFLFRCIINYGLNIIYLLCLEFYVCGLFFFPLIEKTNKTQHQLFIMRNPCFPDYAWNFMFIDHYSFFLTCKMECRQNPMVIVSISKFKHLFLFPVYNEID